jgi:hypothetical protein
MDRRADAPSPALYDNHKAKIESLRQRGFDIPVELITNSPATHLPIAKNLLSDSRARPRLILGHAMADLVDAAVDHDGPGNGQTFSPLSPMVA